MEFRYQIGLLGQPGTDQADTAKAVITAAFIDLGLKQKHICFLDSDDLNKRSRKAPFAAIFFGYSGADSEAHPELDELIEDSVLIIPNVETLSSFSNFVPAQLKRFNGIEDDADCKSSCTIILEHFRLLREERRLFISYKRTDSKYVAHQLYEAFDRRGYDVFLDTRSVRGGAAFQDVLWHRMADSDVVVLLDSQNFHQSEWTQKEYARAVSSQIHIEHVLWPGVNADPRAAFDNFVPLDVSDFKRGIALSEKAQLKNRTIEALVDGVESARARATAERNRMLIDGFCDLARELSFQADLQPGLSIQLLAGQQKILVVPMAGVPNAKRLHSLIEWASTTEHGEKVWAIYDQFGIMKSLVSHIDWLNGLLPISAVPKSSCHAALEELLP